MSSDAGAGSLRAVLLDVMGTMLRLQPPAPIFCAAIADSAGVRVPLAAAERAFAAEIRYYRAHHLQGSDEQSLEALRRGCAEILGAQLGAQLQQAIGAEKMMAAMLASLRFEAYPDVVPALHELRGMGLRLYAVSNWDVSLPEALSRARLLPLLDGCISSASAGAAKPDSAPFTAALRQAGLSAAQAVHVGDSLLEDVRGAEAAGIRPILLSRAPLGEPAPAPARTAVELIGSMRELPALFSSAAG